MWSPLCVAHRFFHTSKKGAQTNATALQLWQRPLPSPETTFAFLIPMNSYGKKHLDGINNRRQLHGVLLICFVSSSSSLSRQLCSPTEDPQAEHLWSIAWGKEQVVLHIYSHRTAKESTSNALCLTIGRSLSWGPLLLL